MMFGELIKKKEDLSKCWLKNICFSVLRAHPAGGWQPPTLLHSRRLAWQVNTSVLYFVWCVHIGNVGPNVHIISGLKVVVPARCRLCYDLCYAVSKNCVFSTCSQCVVAAQCAHICAQTSS